MLKLDFLGHYDFAEMLMLAASSLWSCRPYRDPNCEGLGHPLAAPVPPRRFVTDFWERAKLGGLGLIFLRHSPEFGSDFSARRYPGVTGGKSRKLDQLVVGRHRDRPSPLANRELNGRSSRCDADHPLLDLYSPSQPNAEGFALGARQRGGLINNECAECAVAPSQLSLARWVRFLSMPLGGVGVGYF